MKTQADNRYLLNPNYLLIHCALCFILGTTFALQINSFSILFTVACVPCGILAFWSRRRKSAHGLVLLFIFFLGASLASHSLRPPSVPHIATFITEPTVATCTGVIHEALYRSPERIKIKVELDSLYTQKERGSASRNIGPNLFHNQTHGLVTIGMPFFEHHHLQPGDRITFKAKLSPPRGFANPGGFDLPFFLQSQNIFITGWVSQPETIIKELSPQPSRNPLHFFEKIRTNLIYFLEANLTQPHASLYKALITGDRSGLSPEIQELFINLGIIHLLAISGLHMGLLAGFSMWMATRILRRFPRLLLHLPLQQGAATLAIIPVILYCLISGLHPPALRAGIMTFILFASFLFKRKWHGPTAIAIAALALLIANPLLLHMISFQLSFTAVTAIVLLLPLIKSRLFSQSNPYSWINLIKNTAISGFYISLVASLATLPLLLYHFNRVSLIGPITTLIMEPMLCLWALGFGLTGSALAGITPSLATLLLKTGTLGFSLSLWLGELINTIPNISIWLPTPEKWQISIYYAGFIAVFAYRNRYAVTIFTLCTILLLIPTPRNLNHDRITIIDVGKGNSSLIETRSGETILIDCGGPTSSTFNIGRQVIGPFLFQQKIRKLDLLVLSHADNDHYSGAPFIIEQFKPREIWVPYESSDNQTWNNMLERARNGGIMVKTPRENETYPLRQQSTLTNISSAHLTRENWSQNDKSLVISFKTEPHSFLFPGDIETLGEADLIHSGANISATVLVAPHHGSKSSSTEGFIKHVQPQYVVFSSSPYGHTTFPAPEVFARYTARKTTPLKTAEHGAITFMLQKNHLEITTHQQ